MPAVDLDPLFQILVGVAGSAADRTRLTAVPIPGFERHRLARTSDGDPAILVASRDREHRNYAAPVVLEHLTIQYDTDCRIVQPGGAAEHGVFTLIGCVDPDPHLREHFLRVGGVVIEAVGAEPSRLEIARTMEGLIDLFRALAAPARKSVQGLWAELFLMARSRYPERLANAWHVTPGDTFDFSEGTERIEVKSATGPVRSHHFSLAQLSLPSPAVAVVVSIFVARAGAGESVRDLLKVLHRRLTGYPQLLLRVETVVAATLGNTIQRALTETFDRQLAEASLTLYRADDIPTISGQIDPRVSDVRFVSDLASVPVVTSTDLGSGALCETLMIGRV